MKLSLRRFLFVFATIGLGLGVAAGCSDVGQTADSGGAASTPGGTSSGSSNTAEPAPSVPVGSSSPGASGGGGSGGTASGSGGVATSPGSAGPGSAGASAPGGTPPPSTSPPTNPLPQSGQLTAGTWDDNLNFDFFQRYDQKMLGSQLPGLPMAPVSDRLVVLVTDAGGTPVAGATVRVTSAAVEVAHTQTGADGRALFFPQWSGAAAGAALEITASAGGVQKVATAKAGDPLVTLPLGATGAGVSGLDVAVVIDTTGSMGDEIAYLQSELLAISGEITASYPTVSQRWAYVAYRDYQDSYVTQPFDFTLDTNAFSRSFAMLSAGGGGDFPEAPERGLADLNQLGWRDGAVARVAFWVADAPHHANHASDLVAAIRDAKTRGVHLYPVSASGTDDLLEYSMRFAALVTGGRYLFLTNDSGIGGDHKEPTVPCYLVTTLHKAILRMLQMELTGAHVDPAAADILRTGGNPSDGRCTLDDGQQVQVL